MVARYSIYQDQDNLYKFSSKVDYLVLIALIIELFTPFLIWKGILPASSRFISDVCVALLIFVVYFRILFVNRFPGVLLIILGMASIGVMTAFYNGQNSFATIWGLWIMFRYPLIGVYFYLHPPLPKDSPERLRALCVSIVVLNLIIQLAQYLTGEPPGDNLAGIFGWKGTGPMVTFLAFVICLAMSHWLISGKWQTLALVLAVGVSSSVLGEVKFYLPAALALVGLGFFFFIYQHGQPWRLAPFLTFLFILMAIFVVGYNTYVPGAVEKPIQSYILDSQALDNYINEEYESDVTSDIYIIGRNRAVRYGWDTISREPLTFLLGFGIGAREESQALGIEGIAYSMEARRFFTRNTLLVWVQELGLLGLITMCGFFLWVVFTLFRDIRNDPTSPVNEVRYAILLFSMLLPVLFWYTTVWLYGSTMVLYWGVLGWVMVDSKQVTRANNYSQVESIPAIKIYSDNP